MRSAGFQVLTLILVWTDEALVYSLEAGDLLGSVAECCKVF